MRFVQTAAALAATLAFTLLPPAAAFAAVGVSITVQSGVLGDYTNTSGAAQQDAHFSASSNLNFTTGSGANQANKVYSESVNIAASGSESDDLTSLTDALGAAMDCAAVKAVVLFADATNVNNIVVGNAAATIWSAPFDADTDTITIQPGGKLILENPTAGGWTVDSTHKLLKLANSSSGSAVTGKLFVICI